ncbi:MAG: hypothetical protein JRN62_02305 [Nitrososphaerota archaeon]|jgi:hypothetical protein|nr:hypothetical protein [Nitrososphaerota archaeon]MDG6948844.1 hypothetical protein [Nitrososphaerota archaeon]
MPKDKQKIDYDSFFKEVDNIQGDISQLSEVKELMDEQVAKLVSVLRLLQAKVGASIPIETSLLGEPLVHAKRAEIGVNADIFGYDADDAPFSMSLASLPTDNLLAVVREWVPALKKKLADDKDKMQEALYVIQKMADVLNIQGIVQPEKNESSVESDSMGAAVSDQ